MSSTARRAPRARSGAIAALQLLVVLHQRLLGHLDDQPAQVGHVVEHAQRARVQQRRRGEVDRQARARRAPAEQLQRFAQAGAFQRLALAELVGQREPLQRAARAVGAEARERLEGVDRAAAQVDDRLHDHRQLVAVDRPAQLSARALPAVPAQRAARVDRDLPVAGRLLGDAQRDVRGAQQRLGVARRRAAPARCRPRPTAGEPPPRPAAASRAARSASGDRVAALRRTIRELVAAEAPGDRRRRLPRAPSCSPNDASSASPAACPAVLLIAPKPSRSNSSSDSGRARPARALARSSSRAKRRAREQPGQVVVVGVPARLPQQVVELEREAPDRQQQRRSPRRSGRRVRRSGGLRGSPAAPARSARSARPIQCTLPPRAITPLATAASHSRLSTVTCWPLQADDQDRRGAGQRLLGLQPRRAPAVQVHGRRRDDRREAREPERRVLHQLRFERGSARCPPARSPRAPTRPCAARAGRDRRSRSAPCPRTRHRRGGA